MYIHVFTYHSQNMSKLNKTTWFERNLFRKQNQYFLVIFNTGETGCFSELAKVRGI